MSADYSVEALTEYFKLFGEVPSESVLLKCLELCVVYQLTEEELVDEWQVYCMRNNKQGAPIISDLELLERKNLTAKKVVSVKVNQTEPEKRTKPYEKTTNLSTTHGSQPESQDLNASQREENVSIISQSNSVSVEDYSKRPNAGETALKFGDNFQYITCLKPVSVKQYLVDTLTYNAEFMYQLLGTARQNLSEMTKYIASLIAQQNSIQLPDANQRDVEYIYGRISGIDGAKLNNTTVQLECVCGEYRRPFVPLILSDIKEYSIFSGQVVVAHGKFVKDAFKVDKLFTSAFRPPAHQIELDENFQIIMAAGPFTIKKNLEFEPLQDLIKYVLEKMPHVLILTGPFLDVDHDCIENAEMDTDFQTFFNMVIDSIMTPLHGTNIQVVLVASSRDAHHFVVYPTIPYDIKQKYTNLLCVPDPCLLDINGFIIGVTSTDVVLNMMKHEYCCSTTKSDKVTRICSYLLHQRCFYPLFEVDKTTNSPGIDYEFLNRYGVMETTPNLLILPSKLSYFVKSINGCTVLNPETLVKNYTARTFARINVEANCKVSCQIIRI